MLSFARHLRPNSRVNRRKEGVTFEICVDFGHHQFRGQRQRLGVNLRAADHKSLAVTREPDGVCQRQGRLNAGMRPGWVACHHDVPSVGQGSANRIEGFAAHDDRVATGSALEESQVFREAPWQGVAYADTTMSLGGNDEGECGGHEWRNFRQIDG